MNKLKIFSGNANRPLAEAVCLAFDALVPLPKPLTNPDARFVRESRPVRLQKALVGAFGDGETRVQIAESVRGDDVYIIQPTCAPVNHNLMELLIMVDALKRASAGSITAVIPYYGYARQERKAAPRTPITARLEADLITTAGVDRVIAVDLHAAPIQGFFNIPFDHLYAKFVLAPHLAARYDGCTVVSPDAGGVERARAYSKVIPGSKLAIIDKRREGPGQSEVMHIIGDVNGEDCLIVDDMIDSAGTLVKAAEALMKKGARSVDACATHGVFSDEAVTRIENSALSRVIITDSIMKYHAEPPRRRYGKLEYISIAPLLAEAIYRIHTGQSVSCLFE